MVKIISIYIAIVIVIINHCKFIIVRGTINYGLTSLISGNWLDKENNAT